MDADRSLVDAAAAGSRAAFDELVLRYQGPVTGLVRAMGASDTDADDLVQEAFVRAWRSVRRFRADSTFRTWLFGIAMNVVRTHRLKLARSRLMFWSPAAERDAGSHPIDQASVDDGTEDALAARQMIDRALGTLPEELRAAVVLRDVQGLDYRAIADLLGVPIGKVESRIFRARQRLRPLLESMRKK